MPRKKKDAAPSIGHNSALNAEQQKYLRLTVERIESLEEMKKGTADDIKDVYEAAEEKGFNKKAIREIVKLRKMEKDVRELQEHLVDTYKHALGMLADLPLGQAAVSRQFGDTPLEQSIKKTETFEKVAGAAPVDPQA